MVKKGQKRMGRPPKAKRDKQGCCVMVRMTPSDRARLEADAKTAGLSLSAYLLERWKKGRD